jgi:hypothetical protein
MYTGISIEMVCSIFRPMRRKVPSFRMERTGKPVFLTNREQGRKLLLQKVKQGASLPCRY